MKNIRNYGIVTGKLACAVLFFSGRGFCSDV